jgi:hypothetical protein
MDDEEFTGQLRFSHDIKAYVTLTGTGFAPLAFEPAKELVFPGSADPNRRIATVTLLNRTDAARPVDLEYPENVSGPEQLLMKPHEDKTITLQIAPAFLGNIESAVTFESEGYRVSLPVKAGAVRPILSATPAALAFGALASGDHKELAFELKNSGGSPAQLKVTPPRELVISPDPATAVIPVGESRKFTAVLELSKQGGFEETLAIDYGGDTSLTLPVTAEITANTQSSRPTVVAIPEGNTPQRQETPGPIFSLDPPEPAGNEIPPIAEFNHLRTDTHEVEIGWKIPAKNAISYLIEWRQVMVPAGDGPPIVKWNEWRGVQTSEVNGSIIARFPNLKDGQTWRIRIRTVDELGKKSAASPTFIISTKVDQSMGLFGWLVILTGIGAVAAAIIFWRKQRHAVDDDESARISALENK